MIKSARCCSRSQLPETPAPVESNDASWPPRAGHPLPHRCDHVHAHPIHTHIHK